MTINIEKDHKCITVWVLLRSVGSEEEPQHQPVLVPADETYNAAKPFIFYSYYLAL